MRPDLAVRLAALAAAALVALASPAAAQSTITVTFRSDAFAYAVDGQVQGERTLVRGRTYTFQMAGIPGVHPFYISTSSSGGGAGAWSQGVTGSGATGNAALTFAVPANAPDELWYQCGSHTGMGGRLQITNATSGEPQPEGPPLVLRVPNPVGAAGATATLELRAAAAVAVDLLDATGRLVRRLADGPRPAGASPVALDVRGLAAGRYAVRAVADGVPVVQALTVVR